MYFSWRLPESSASIQPVLPTAEQLLSASFQEQLYVLSFAIYFSVEIFNVYMSLKAGVFFFPPNSLADSAVLLYYTCSFNENVLQRLVAPADPPNAEHGVGIEQQGGGLGLPQPAAGHRLRRVASSARNY